MTHLKENLIQLVITLLFLALVLFGLSFIPSSLKNPPQDVPQSQTPEPVVSDQEQTPPLIPADEIVYGFSIGTIHRAYPISAFADKDIVYDVILGEPVIIGSSYSGGGVIMTHGETGEVFPSEQMKWGEWYAAYPDTTLYQEQSQ